MIRAYIEQLGSVGPDRMLRLVNERTVGAFYVYVGPENAASKANRQVWNGADVPRWAWYVCSPDQEADLAHIEQLDAELNPAGWCLNIEKVLEGASLTTLLEGVYALGKPIVASLGGAYSPTHMSFDYRMLEKYGVACEWQAYFDSGEGCTPADAVQELYASSFVIPGWEYRHRLGYAYGFGKVSRIGADQVAYFSSYKRPRYEATFAVVKRAWGFTVVSRDLYREGLKVGLLMGRAAYPKIRVALDVTRTAANRSPAEWTPIAASARIPGASKRGVTIYLLDVCPDDVVKAIAAGAA